MVVDFVYELDQIKKFLGWGSGGGALGSLPGKHEDQSSDPWHLV